MLKGGRVDATPTSDPLAELPEDPDDRVAELQRRLAGSSQRNEELGKRLKELCEESPGFDSP